MNYCKITSIFILLFVWTVSVFAQPGGCGTLYPSESSVDFSKSGGTDTSIDIIREACSGTLSLFNNNEVPDWLEGTEIIGNNIRVKCASNDGTARQHVVAININGVIRSSFTVYQNRTPPTPIPTPVPTSCEISGFTGHSFGVAGGLVEYPLSFSNCNANSASFTFKGTAEFGGKLPNWLAISSNGISININCSSNYNNERRTVVVLVTATIKGGEVLNFGAFIEQDTCLVEFYPDTDRDGLGDHDADSIKACPGSEPDGWVGNNNDLCPLMANRESNTGCPLGIIADDINWIYTISKDRDGNVKADNYTYYDDLGKDIQNRTVDLKTKKVWYTSTLYDGQGRAALTTLKAPSGISSFYENGDVSMDKGYNPDFIKGTTEHNFMLNDLGTLTNDPSPVSTTVNTLGWYYSNSNTSEEFQDVTNRPYVRSFYSDLNPGAVLKTVGGNKIDGVWKQGYSFTMPASQELSQKGAFGEAKYSNYKVLKTIVRDVHGIETVVFSDSDGNTLAVAHSGNQENENVPNRDMSIEVGAQEYVDIHIPVGCSGIRVTGVLANQVTVYDLISEQEVTTSLETLPAGFYRVAIASIPNSNVVVVHYKENYYDYSLSYYDKANRLVKSTQPLSKGLESLYEYNTLGQLIYTKSPDEGEAWFKYRRGGQIRFSQSSKQRILGEFSYTNYDNHQRPIESGVVTSAIFDTLNGDEELPDGTKKEVSHTAYDVISVKDINALPVNYKNPSFLSANVAKTWNENSTTWYSYDIYGRVKWIVQNIVDLGFKTIDYVYDDITSQVTKVYYQKDQTDQFIHRYEYDLDDYSLIKVETSVDDMHFEEQAAYHYYENGALKRTNLAEGLQGIDYVYNLNGQLKSINHPDLNETSDPGNDANDLFGMQLHYYDGDYLRNTVKPISSITAGQDQYNGNIKAITWNTNSDVISGGSNSYYYKYNRNNWLEGAGFNNPDIVDIDKNALKIIEIHNQPIETSTTIEAKRQVKLTEGFQFTAGIAKQFIGRTKSDGVTEDSGEDYDVYGITYDANGNIQTLNRNKDSSQGSNIMDQLTYRYKTDKPNQLLRVDDVVSVKTNADDLKDQNGENYEYNSIGQLTKNNSENIEYLYNTSGLVAKVSAPRWLVEFDYDDKGKRLSKMFTVSGGRPEKTFYVRDAAGRVLAIYKSVNATPVTLVEHTIYGTGRLGVRKPDGTSVYQLTDHLGNVRAVVAKDAEDNAKALTATDYYPFGMPMPNRNIEGDYRYKYQGQEKDPETGREAFQLRLWDARIGRWSTTDPYGQYSSPYLGMGNNPISQVDPDGGMSNPKCPEGQDCTGMRNELDQVIVIGSSRSGWFNNLIEQVSSIKISKFEDPWPEYKIDWLDNKSSGSKIYGSGTKDNGRSLGLDGEIYDSIDFNDIIQPGNAGGRFKTTGARIARATKAWRGAFNIIKNSKKAHGVLNREVFKEIDITVYNDGIGRSPFIKPTSVDQAKKDAVKAMQGVHKPDSVVLEYIYETTLESLIIYPYK